jgi:hypothetical protein
MSIGGQFIRARLRLRRRVNDAFEKQLLRPNRLPKYR